MLLTMTWLGWSGLPVCALVVSDPDGSEIVTGQRAVVVPGMPVPLDRIVLS